MSVLDQSSLNQSSSGKLVMLRLEGDLEQQGFQVTLEISEAGAGPLLEVQGRLPADPILVTLLHQWQQSYRSLAIANRLTPKEIIYGGSIHPIENCRQFAQQLHDRFSQWLNAESFQLLNQRLREELNRDQPARFLLRSSNLTIRQLPWSTWNLVERYPQLEIALSPISFESRQRIRLPSEAGQAINSQAVNSQAVKILAIIGNSDGIDTTRDRTLLNNLPNAKVTFLVEPLRQEISDQLWQQSWDILFFAGHSETERDSAGERDDGGKARESSQGRIYINRQDSLTLTELKYGLQRSIDRGLQLAIFNSCDGLGLAQELEQLQIPHLIVMRQPVPDRIAQAFLTYFLGAFAQGDPLDLAERQARERLQGWEHEFPCASWLPILTQNPAATMLTWHSLSLANSGSIHSSLAQSSLADFRTANPSSASSSSASSSLTHSSSVSIAALSSDLAPGQPSLPPPVRTTRQLDWKAVMIASSLVTSLIVGVRSLGLLQPSELSAFDQFVRWRPAEIADPRLLVVTVDQADIQYQDQQGMERRGSLSDQALLRLLEKLQPYQPSVIGLDIYHDFAFTADLTKRLQQMPPLIAICQIAETDEAPTAIAPPPGLSPSQIGFADLPVDAQYIIRRQLLGMPAGQVCPTSQSFSLQIALNYLAQQGIPPLTWTENREVKIGNVTLPKLSHQAGGYQLSPIEANGYQIMLNYRTHSPQQIPLRVLLNQQLPQPQLSLAPHPIVLIGVNHSQDLQFTPFGQDFGDRVPGVVIHAQMVSQIISAVLERRPLLWWLPEWAEVVWIGGWAIAGGGGAMGWLRRRDRVTQTGQLLGQLLGQSLGGSLLKGGLTLGLAIGLLSGGCFVVFLQGGWMPLVPAILSLILTPGSLILVFH